jgi:hypothetical protein
MRVLTSLVLLFVALPALGDTSDRTKATVAYLRKLQSGEGGFAPDATKDKPSLRATLAALRALKYMGGEAPDRAGAARFVVSCHDKESGGFADVPGGKADVTLTAVGAMALVELRLPTEPYEAGLLRFLGTHSKNFEEIRLAAAAFEALGKQPPEAAEWLRRIESERNSDGTFGAAGDARTNGGTTVAILRLGGKVRDPARVLAALDAGQHADGGFGKGKRDEPSDLESTYRVLRCYHMLKGKPKDVRALQSFLSRCFNADGGYGIAPGQPSSVGATYYAAIVRHWLEEP